MSSVTSLTSSNPLAFELAVPFLNAQQLNLISAFNDGLADFPATNDNELMSWGFAVTLVELKKIKPGDKILVPSIEKSSSQPLDLNYLRSSKPVVALIQGLVLNKGGNGRMTVKIMGPVINEDASSVFESKCYSAVLDPNLCTMSTLMSASWMSLRT